MGWCLGLQASQRHAPPPPRQIWRTPFSPALVEMLRPSLGALPQTYQHARAYHVGVNPDDPSLPLLHELRAARGGTGACLSITVCVRAHTR